MLGYVRTDNRELRVRELECYRGLYCGLCKAMGGCTGQRSRLSLCYDFVFLCALRASLLEEVPTFHKKNCVAHPFRRRLMADRSPTLDYCAHASALLTYHKCRDDLSDEKGGRRLKAFFARGLMKKAYKRAKKQYPVLDGNIQERLAALSDYEKSQPEFPSADTPAALFGGVMAEVFSWGLPVDRAPIARELGQAMGHWVYLCDAADDLLEDQKRGRYNPLLLLCGNTPTAADLENVRLSMLGQLSRCEAALDLVESPGAVELKEILSNVLYLGMPERAKEITQRTADGLEPKNKKDRKAAKRREKKEGVVCCNLECCAEGGCECCGEIGCMVCCDACGDVCSGIG